MAGTATPTICASSTTLPTSASTSSGRPFGTSCSIEVLWARTAAAPAMHIVASGSFASGLVVVAICIASIIAAAIACPGNGVRIVASGLPHLQSVNVSVFARTGSSHESRRLNGHFVERMALKGTHGRGCQQINLDAKRLGTCWRRTQHWRSPAG
jgi:Insulinase (Peptidase family M16)